jgi:hypothetical protein
MLTGSGVEDLTVGGKVFMYLFGPAIKTRKGRPYEAGEKVWNPGRLGVLSSHHYDRSLRGGPIIWIGNIFDGVRSSLALLAALPFAWPFFSIEHRS